MGPTSKGRAREGRKGEGKGRGEEKGSVGKRKSGKNGATGGWSSKFCCVVAPLCNSLTKKELKSTMVPMLILY